MIEVARIQGKLFETMKEAEADGLVPTIFDPPSLVSGVSTPMSRTRSPFSHKKRIAIDYALCQNRCGRQMLHQFLLSSRMQLIVCRSSGLAQLLFSADQAI
jgi:hypothetical protein